ncbi:hypothetical protein ACOMHN_035649 [Nucella lapillus]
MWCSDNNDAACSWLDSSQEEQNVLRSGSYGDFTAYTAQSFAECFQQETASSRDTSENSDNLTTTMSSMTTSECSEYSAMCSTYRGSSVRSDNSSTRSSTGSGYEADTVTLQWQHQKFRLLQSLKLRRRTVIVF